MNCCDEKCVPNKVLIDIAVLCQEYTKIDVSCDDHITNLDEIPITLEMFKSIFYPYSENFGLNKDYVCCDEEISPYVSFLPNYRTVNCKKFYLLEQIFSNIESDLNISRNCFTAESRVELTSEILNINSLCDLNMCSVLTSLTWCNILDIINNYQTIDKKCHIKNIIPICVVSVVFKTPTPGVKNTIIRLNYRIIDI